MLPAATRGCGAVVRPALRGERGAGLARAHGGRALRLALHPRAAPGLGFLRRPRRPRRGSSSSLRRSTPAGPRVPRAGLGSPGTRGRASGAAPRLPERGRAPARALAPGWGDPGGSTALALLVSPRFLYLAHCGDSRAVLSRAGTVTFSTEDHRPLRPRERERIYDAGGTIRRRRVEGSLAVSRALGDFTSKEAPGRPPELQLVSAEPEVAALARQAEDEFVLLASDGVWDAMSAAALAGLASSRLRLGLAPELLCAQLLDTLPVQGAPRPFEEAIQRERALDKALGHRVADLCASAQKPPSLNSIFKTLVSEDIMDLPPGGGLHCKAAIIAEAYSHLCGASEEHSEKRQGGPGKPTGSPSNADPEA